MPASLVPGPAPPGPAVFGRIPEIAAVAADIAVVSEWPAGAAAVASAGRASRTAYELAIELDDLENNEGHDIDAILAGAIDVQQAADAIGEVVLGHRARLVQADMSQRSGDVGVAARTFSEIHRWAEQNGSPALQARSHFHLALTYHYLGDRAASLEHAICSVELLDEATPPGLRVLHLIRLANSLAEGGSVDAARERYLQAERLAVAIGDPTRQLSVLNNLAYTEHEVGDPDKAWAVVERMHVAANALGRDFLITERDTIANIQISRGEYAAAEETVQAAVNAPQWFEVHDLADAALTLAEAQRRLGAIDRAQASLDRCRVLCDERELAGVRVRVMAEQAELYAATGDHRSAFEEYKRFHTAAEELRSSQLEARAHTRQAMFETAEARQAAERYREQARRDPLTGLYNRRHVDEQLPVAIAQAGATGLPLTVALVDLDHFKRINDTFSHDVGDQVLSAVAELLTSAQAMIAEAGFVARMGGEEFLLCLPGVTAADARARLDALRLVISSHPWRPLTGDLPVAVSIGATTTSGTGDDTHMTLLAAADRNLYAAKDAGRDRVVTRPAT
jgi:diguanylate cyclase (GGDEF)-like protein